MLNALSDKAKMRLTIAALLVAALTFNWDQTVATYETIKLDLHQLVLWLALGGNDNV